MSGMNFDSMVPLTDDVDLGQYRIKGVRNAQGKIVRYLPQDIETAATVFCLTGLLTKTSEVLGISTAALGKWTEREEWINTVTRIQRQHSYELDHKLSNIINLAYDSVVDRLVNGDEVVTKEGEKVRKKMSGRDAAWIGSVLFDKRQIGRKLPTAISEAVNADEKLNQIAQKMAEMAAAMPPPVRDITPAIDANSTPATIDVAEDDDMGKSVQPHNGMRPLGPSLSDGPDFQPVKPTPHNRNAALKEDLSATTYTLVEDEPPAQAQAPTPKGAMTPFGNLDVDDLI